MSVEDEVRRLSAIASTRLDQAYAELGFRPGPGVDIFIVPTSPISQVWNLRPATDCGKAFLLRFHPTYIIQNGRPLRDFRDSCIDWGLTFSTDWSNVVSVKS